jgi:hypothetical protein
MNIVGQPASKRGHSVEWNCKEERVDRMSGRTEAISSDKLELKSSDRGKISDNGGNFETAQAEYLGRRWRCNACRCTREILLALVNNRPSGRRCPRRSGP